MQTIDIITVPYDSARRGWRMGAGPGAFLRGGLARTLDGWGHEVRVIEVELCDDGAADVAGDADTVLAATMQLAGTTSQHVRSARRDGRFPLVLAGNCYMTVGALAALDGAAVAVAWLDAHGDLNTPATSPSGFVDGMAAAALLGWCHTAETGSLAGFRPPPAQRFLLLGTRSLDAGEAEAAERRAVRVLPPDAVASESALARALDDVLGHADGVWLHIDLDVLDPASVAPANAFAAPGGLTPYQAVRVVQEAAARGPVAGLTLSALDPAVDEDGIVRAAALALISEALAGDGAR
jgi:arginase